MLITITKGNLNPIKCRCMFIRTSWPIFRILEIGVIYFDQSKIELVS